MANELTKKEETMVSLVQGNELGDIIKPLIKEIHLCCAPLSLTYN